MGKGSAPPPPDYVGAAQLQGELSKEALNMQNFANRPVQNTPFGSTTWDTQAVRDPATGDLVTQWTQNTTLASELQNALESQLGIQQGRSDLASGFMGRVASEYGQPFDWQNLPALTSAGTPAQLQTATADYVPGLQTDVGRTNFVGGFNFGGPQMGVESMTGDIQRGVAPTGVNTGFTSMTGGLAGQTGQEAVQRGLNVVDNPALPAFDASYRDRIASDLMARMQPQQDYARQQLETQLSNQGFQVGTEGYQRALDDLAQRQAAERFNALDIAGNEAQRLYGMQMGQRQQAFQEDVTGGQFANQAANQAFQQGLAANQFQNQALNQAFQQDMAARQAQNQALQQQFGQQLAAGQFGNEATQQAYAQGLGATEAANRAAAQQFQQNLAANQFRNQAAQQAFGQNLGAAQFANQAGGQAFQQGLAGAEFANQATQQAFNQAVGAGQFGNQAQNQLYQQMMGQANLANQAGQQQFAQNLAAAQFGNQALGQASALDLQRMQAQNQAASQQFALNQQYANQMNQLRQQAIAEQMQRRGMSLNEMNALLSGQQVGMPQMPTFNASGRAETPQILNATQMGYDAALGAYNAQQAGAANLMGGLFNLGAGALSGGLFGIGG